MEAAFTASALMGPFTNWLNRPGFHGGPLG
jgi:hypothetical protein